MSHSLSHHTRYLMRRVLDVNSIKLQNNSQQAWFHDTFQRPNSNLITFQKPFQKTFHYRKAVGPSAKKHSPLWHHWLILLLLRYLIQLCSFELWHSLQRPAAHRQPAASCTCPDFHFLFFQRCARQDESNSCLRSYGVYFFCQKLGVIPSWSESSSLADALVTPHSVSASEGFHYSRNSFPLANSFFPFQLSLTANP